MRSKLAAAAFLLFTISTPAFAVEPSGVRQGPGLRDPGRVIRKVIAKIKAANPFTISTNDHALIPPRP